MKLSLIVPTYNRSHYLRDSLPSFANQTMDKQSYEILVIDNNSTDDTRDVVLSVMDQFTCNWRYIFEKQQGLHCARNKGILESKGSIVVFGDDDIVASRQWLQVLCNEFESNKKAGVVGGKILPIWEKMPPQWIYDWGSKGTHTVFAYLDNGHERRTDGEYMIFGCNFAITKELAIRVGGSLPDTFPRRLYYKSGRGEGGMREQVLRLGFEVVYLPEAIVSHHIAASRVTPEYFLDRYDRLAIEAVYALFRREEMLGGKVTRGTIFIAKTILEIILLEKNIGEKINRPLYKKIMIRYLLGKIKQTIRVLNDSELYQYIRRPSYLDEIKLVP
jgi:glycosyltransferase involved in cell wall biosynthesis